MKVLITGGAGFIGSHLAQRILSDGCEVIVIDDLPSLSGMNPSRMQGKFDVGRGTATGDGCDNQ